MKPHPLRITVPVECQNGHKARWTFEIKGLDGLDWHNLGVPQEEKCSCPKWGIGTGYHRVDGPIEIEGYDIHVARDYKEDEQQEIIRQAFSYLEYEYESAIGPDGVPELRIYGVPSEKEREVFDAAHDVSFKLGSEKGICIVPIILQKERQR